MSELNREIRENANAMFIKPNGNDDAGFVLLAEKAVRGWASLVSATYLHVVKVDSWFGGKWYGFAGKALGALGVHHRSDLRVPPFHPHRIVAEYRFRMGDTPAWVPYDDYLHHFRSSDSNLRNRITRFGDSIAFAWYGGGTRDSGRGSVMGYASTPHGTLGWYAGLSRGDDGWKVVDLLGADQRQWAAMLGRVESGDERSNT
jgi:hypothetical protein